MKAKEYFKKQKQEQKIANLKCAKFVENITTIEDFEFKESSKPIDENSQEVNIDELREIETRSSKVVIDLEEDIEENIEDECLNIIDWNVNNIENYIDNIRYIDLQFLCYNNLELFQYICKNYNNIIFNNIIELISMLLNLKRYEIIEKDIICNCIEFISSDLRIIQKIIKISYDRDDINLYSILEMRLQNLHDFYILSDETFFDFEEFKKTKFYKKINRAFINNKENLTKYFINKLALRFGKQFYEIMLKYIFNIEINYKKQITKKFTIIIKKYIFNIEQTLECEMKKLEDLREDNFILYPDTEPLSHV